MILSLLFIVFCQEEGKGNDAKGDEGYKTSNAEKRSIHNGGWLVPAFIGLGVIKCHHYRRH